MYRFQHSLFALTLSFLLPGSLYAQEAGSARGVPELSACPTPIDKNLPPVKDMLNWDQASRLIGFRNDYRSYPGDVFKHATSAALPESLVNLDNAGYEIKGLHYTLKDYFKRSDVRGFLVIKNGHIAYEYFAGGNNKTTLWTSRSVGKSIVSTLVGIAIKEGKIKSLDDKLVIYNPDLKGTDWADVSIRQLMQHTSGVQWNENYNDPKSNFSKLTQCEAGSNTYKCVEKLIYPLKRKSGVKPGEVWSYSSGGAWMLGDVLEHATGMPIAQYLQEKMWQPFGMANDGVWHSYEKGKHDIGAHGFNATLEDWGRFGLFVANNGKLPNGETILPDNWVKEARTWTQAKNSVT